MYDAPAGDRGSERHRGFPDRGSRSLTMEMEPEKVSMSKELGPGSPAYRCSACHGDEEWNFNPPLRGRAKSRSLSASPAPGSTKEFRRTRSLHGPCPVTTFGPKACVLQNPQTIMHIQDPASQRLTWNKCPKSVLVIKKIRDASLLQPFKELCEYLMEENNMIVYVEKKVLEDPAIVGDENFGPVKKKFCTFREDYDDISNQIDFIICLGGDGTLLYASSLFQRAAGHGLPPGLPGLPDPVHLRELPGPSRAGDRGERGRRAAQPAEGACGEGAPRDGGRAERGAGPGPGARGRQAGPQRGGDRQGPLLVPVQRGRLPGRTPDHHGAGRRRDRVHPDGQHGVRGRGRGLHDPPQRARHHAHPHLPALAVLQAHRGPRGRGAQDHTVPGGAEHGVGVLRWAEETGDRPRGQHQHHHLLLPAALHLRPRPRERLVREPGPVPALERAQEAGPLRRGRGRRRGRWPGRTGLGPCAHRCFPAAPEGLTFAFCQPDGLFLTFKI
ncbi:NAD kinase isoform X2 [Dasypus novemcinctus]|uniref:NAD kinase isoform X2 n=1 Tax=Dasypus novemcinctus TaxID=9361 RepID=UPI0026601C92|nr:NAD kinase isoform X2 [Dasypus novemcinctus]